MKLIHYLSLYIDSFKRFSSSQLFYWILNKYIKKLVPTNFYIGRLDQNELIPFDTIRSRLINSLVLNRPLSLNNANCDTDFKLIHHYFNDVDEIFISLDRNKSEFENFWKIIEDQTDLEIQNNYQRFYFFAETIEVNNFNPEFGLKLIDEWIDRFPPSKDISWNTFNCTIRLINWFKILGKLPKEYKINRNLWNKIHISIYKQINYISSHIEYHIPGNHIIIQLYVLWLVSVVFPAWNKTIKKISEAEKLFKKELQNEFLTNGFHFEHSYHYHVQVTLFGMLWLIGMKNLNNFVEENVLKILTSTSLLLEEFINPNGYLPMLGDNCFCFLTRNLYEDIELFKILKPMALTGVFPKVKSSKVLDIKGSYVLARSFESEIIFDVSNIGLPNNPGHGHSDLLSIIYSFKGHPIFVDPGTKKYSSDQASFVMKKAISHNTISIGRNDQAKLWGFFRWGYLPENLSYNIEESEMAINLSGKYYGFKHIGGYEHSRKIVMGKDNLQIEDHINGKKNNMVELNFVLHPSVSALVNDGLILIVHNDFELKFNIQSDFKYTVNIESFDMFPSYDVLIPTQKIRVVFENITFPFFSKVIISYLS
ncbi:MAG: alginate lyase family protein [Bacteroidetes bacterium]|nr:alginate lyase family protein [Bacteroidota bacterium]